MEVVRETSPKKTNNKKNKSIMKKNIFSFVLVAISTLILSAACSKMDAPSQEELFQTCDIVSLHIPATAETKHEIAVYDSDYVQITSDIVSIPGSAEEVIDLNFVSEAEPAFIYTPGLANGDDESGFLRIGGKQIKTKVGEDGTILLVIKK